MTVTSQNIPGEIEHKSSRSNWQAGTPEGPVVKIAKNIRPCPKRSPSVGTDGSHLSDVHVEMLSPFPGELTDRRKTFSTNKKRS